MLTVESFYYFDRELFYEQKKERKKVSVSQFGRREPRVILLLQCLWRYLYTINHVVPLV